MIKFFGYSIYALIFIAFLEVLSFFALTIRDMDKGDVSARHLYHPYRSHQLNPQYQRKFDTGGVKIHSSDGFRSDHPISKKKSKDVYRIIMFGGSALYGIGVQDGSIYPNHPSLSNEQTVNHFLEMSLNEKAGNNGRVKNVEIINAGVTAYETFQHLIYFNETIFEYQPDLIIFFDGHNDFYSQPGYNQWHNYSYSGIKLAQSMNEQSFIFSIYTLSRSLGVHSYTLKLVEKIFQKIWEQNTTASFLNIETPETKPSLDHKYLRDHFDNTIIKTYSQFQALSNLLEFKMLVILQPEIVFENSELLSNQDKSIRDTTLSLFTEGQQEYMNNVRSFLPKIFKEKNIEFFDAGEIALSNTKSLNLYLDYCHLSPKGSEIVSQIISEKMWDFIKEDL